MTASDLGGEALQIAIETMESGRHVEYACYQDDGTPQGRAVIKLLQREDQAQGLLTAVHGEASDEYYQWYADHELAAGAVYHVCSSGHAACRRRLARGDRRHLVHLDHWRLLSPAVMLAVDYLRPLGTRLGKKLLDNAAQQKAEHQVPDPPVGTGLEAAAKAAAAQAEKALRKEEREGRERSPRRGRSERSREDRRGLGAWMSIWRRTSRGPEGLSDPGQTKRRNETKRSKAMAERERPVAMQSAVMRRIPRGPAAAAPVRIFGQPQLGEGTCGDWRKRSPGIWRSDL